MADLNVLIARMRYWCDVASLGYSQSDRWDIRDGGNADCSSLVIWCLREAGFDTGSATYTGNLSANLTARGWARLPNDGNPLPGDILLNDADHVAVYIGGGRLAQASMSEYGTAWGSGGDQTGGETNTNPYYDYPWDCYLRFTGQQTSVASAAPARLATHVHYRLRQQGGGWLDEVTDFGPGDNGFAGMPCSSHDLLAVRVDEGSLRYRTHLLGGGWQDWVDHSDINDTVHGCAGVPGQAIDGVQLYYTTPAGKPLSQAWYRSQTASRQGWLPVVCDDGTSCGGDTFAGMYGEPLDRLQIAITDQNPYQ